MSINWNASGARLPRMRAHLRIDGRATPRNHRIGVVRRINSYASVLRFGPYASAAFSPGLPSTTGCVTSTLSLNR
jgi:hypothetical protein